MARLPRSDAIDESTVGVYHCINRCVRRAFLCGDDPVSGNNYDHRKTWIQERLEFLASQFGIDVIGFSVMSNIFTRSSGIGPTSSQVGRTARWRGGGGTCFPNVVTPLAARLRLDARNSRDWRARSTNFANGSRASPG